MPIKQKTLSLAFIVSLAAGGCDNTSDTCSDLAGSITHSTIEITGIEATSVFRQSDNSNVLEAVDQFNGTEFSNLIVRIELSWSEEQHRFREANTFLQSFLNSLVKPVMACTLPPYYEEYQPVVSDLQIYSDSDLSADYTAGSDLSQLFIASGSIGDSTSLSESSEVGSIVSARSYSLRPRWVGGNLVTNPTTPSQHIFTIMISLADGRSFEIRTTEVVLLGT